MNFDDRLRETFRQEAGALEHRRTNRAKDTGGATSPTGSRRSGVLAGALVGGVVVLAAVLIGVSALWTRGGDEPTSVEVADRPAPQPIDEPAPEDATAPVDEPTGAGAGSVEPADDQLPPTPPAPDPPPASCKPQAWLALHDEDPTPTCISLADFDQLTIINKGFDRLVIEWVDGTRELGSDESFTYPAEQLGAGYHSFVSEPYAMPLIRVVPRAESLYADWEPRADGFGPLSYGAHIDDIATGQGVSVELDEGEGPCRFGVLANDPYSPTLVFARDTNQLVTAIAASADNGPYPEQCASADDLAELEASRFCGGHEGPAFPIAMVRNVAPDDPDGGLVVHASPGVDGPVIGVIPHDAFGIEVTGGCTYVDDGGLWWEIDYLGTPGWVNTNYLVAPESQPACGEHGWLESVRAADADFDSYVTGPTGATNERIASITAQALGDCVAVVITFGEGPVTAGVSEYSAQVMGGVEIISHLGVTAVALPSGIGDDVPLVSPAPIAEWSNPADGRPGVAALVNEDGETVVFVVNNSTELPRMATASNPARLILSYFDEAPVLDVFTPSDSFFVTPIRQLNDGAVVVRGFGGAFEAHAGVVVIDGAGTVVDEAVFSGESITFGPQQGQATFRTGNPGVAYARFSFEIRELPPGDYELVLDPCGGACDPPDELRGIAFSVN